MRLVILLVGLLGGVCAGLLAVAYNPLAGADIRTLPNADSYSFVSSEVAGMPRDAYGAMNLGLFASYPADFAEPTIKNSYASIATLRDSAGVPAALAVKLSGVVPEGNLLTGDVTSQSYWMVFWPNQGSVFMNGLENHWPMLSASVRSAVSGGSLSSGSISYDVSPRPETKAEQRVIGLTGIYSSVRGTFAELADSPDSDSDLFQGELSIQTK